MGINRLAGSEEGQGLNLIIGNSNLQKKQEMAFVFRSKVELHSPNPLPGPAYYSPSQHPHSPNPHPVPFNQSAPRHLWNKNQNPGPGTYHYPQQPPDTQLTPLQAASKSFTFKAPCQTSNFKSGCQRFKDNQSTSPGPGNYDSPLATKPAQPKRPPTQHTSLQKYLRGIHQVSPKCEEDLLAIVNDSRLQHNSSKGQMGDKGGEKKGEKNVPFGSTVPREFKERPKTSVGPGSYNLVSKEFEVCEQKSTRKLSQSVVKFKKVPVQQERGVETVRKDCQLGAGTTLHDCTTGEDQSALLKRSFNQRKDDFFGSTVSRFASTEVVSNPGPADYDPRPLSGKPEASKRSLVSFGRYAAPSSGQAEMVVSPFFALQVQKKSVPKQEKPSEGSFGSKQPRFRELKENQTQCLFQPEMMRIGTVGKQKTSTKAKPKKRGSEAQRGAQESVRLDERPLAYASNAHTIQLKVGLKYQKKAPFSSQAPRFQTHQHDNNILNDYLTQAESAGKKGREGGESGKERSRLRQGESKGLMASGGARFKENEEGGRVGPGSYDPQVPSQKEYNKLFV